MNKVKRWELIKELLSQKEYITVEEFAEFLNVSIPTVRRDLKELDEKGEIKRFRGGASLNNNLTLKKVLTFENRVSQKYEEKVKIAQKAVDLINDGDSIFLDASSISYHMAGLIKVKNILVVTNSYSVVPKLLEKGIRTYVLNGFVAPGGTILGQDTIEKVKSFIFDKAFLGVYGINIAQGYTTYEISDGELKKEIISRSTKTYVLADERKFEKWSFYIWGRISDATIITDKKTKINENIEDIIFV